ncbi:matrilin-2 [Folsomia candida]|uniref:matrilin-2 n=1 Tax=Folsomia candida TaxID=158441 RepID=UPI00160527EB|nr:matrilin-2 [Folsomia candida]
MTVFGYVVHCLTQTAKLDDSHPIFLDKKPAKRKMDRTLIRALTTTAFCIPLMWGSVASSDLGRNYKEPCSADDPCNPIKFLECTKGLCECTSPKEIVFDSSSSSCVAKVGFSCLREIPGQKKAKRSSDIGHNETERTEITPIGPYQIICVPNAKCQYPSDICECDFRHYKSPTDGTCLRQKGLGEKCSGQDQCDQYEFLTCSGGTCSCDRDQWYDHKNRKCVVSVGSRCKTIDYRTVNEEHYVQHQCPEMSHCNPDPLHANDNFGFGVCQCDPGLKVTLDRKTCAKDYGDACSGQRKCSDVQFICRSGTCQCKYPLHQFYDEVTKSCISFSGGPCDVPNHNASSNRNGSAAATTTTSIDDPGMGCTENSVCAENPPFNYCRCSPGFIEGNDGKCVKAFGSSCEVDEECDPLPQLACINNVCNCPDTLQVYEEKHRTCVSLAGGRCRKEFNGTIPSCTSNAYCVKASGRLEYGRCICARGTYTTANRTCSKGP